jgi:hypothetical protein
MRAWMPLYGCYPALELKKPEKNPSGFWAGSLAGILAGILAGMMGAVPKVIRTGNPGMGILAGELTADPVRILRESRRGIPAGMPVMALPKSTMATLQTPFQTTLQARLLPDSLWYGVSVRMKKHCRKLWNRPLWICRPERRQTQDSPPLREEARMDAAGYVCLFNSRWMALIFRAISV